MPRSTPAWVVAEPLLEVCVGQSVTQILGSGARSALLTSGRDHDALWSLGNIAKTSCQAEEEGHKTKRWVAHPTQTEWLLLLRDFTVEIRRWSTLQCLSTIDIANTTDPMSRIERVISLNSPRYFATVATDAGTAEQPKYSANTKRRILIWDFNNFSDETVTTTPLPSCKLGTLSESIQAIIGVYGDRLVYADAGYWVCTVDVSDDSLEEVPVRHFFIPNDWLSVVSQLVMEIGRAGEIVFLKQSDLEVIRRGLRGYRQWRAFQSAPQERTRGYACASGPVNAAMEECEDDVSNGFVFRTPPFQQGKSRRTIDLRTSMVRVVNSDRPWRVLLHMWLPKRSEQL